MNDLNLKKKVLECYVEICREIPECITDLSNYFQKNLENLILSNNNELSIDALEIWCTISEEDYSQKISNKRKTFICTYVSNDLLRYIKYHLLNRDKKSEKEDPDSWQPYKSALFILRNLSYICEGEVYEFIYQLIGENINSSDSRIKQSVILGYGTILNRRYLKNIKLNISSVVESFMNILLNEENKEVRFSLVWVFKKFIQKIPESILELSENHRLLIIQGLLGFLSLENKKSNNQIISEVCKFFDFYIENECQYEKSKNKENLQNTEENGNDFPSSILSDFYENIISMLVTLALNALETKSGLVDCSLSLLSSMTKYAPKNVDLIFEKIFPNLIDLLNQTCEKNISQDLETKYELQENICIVISHIIAYEKLKLDAVKSKFLYELIRKIFMSRGGCFSGGISLCTSLAIYLKENFAEISMDYLNFLNVAISEINNVAVCSSGLNSFSELIRSLGTIIEDYMNELFPLVNAIINVRNVFKIIF